MNLKMENVKLKMNKSQNINSPMSEESSQFEKDPKAIRNKHLPDYQEKI